MSAFPRRYLVDTNVLLRDAQLSHELHAIAAEAIRTVMASDANVYIVPQVFYEFWAVATRPASARGCLGWTPAQADIEASRLETLFELLTDVPAIYSNWRRLVVTYKVSGLQAHDARLVAAMQVHGLTHVLTFDVDHFQRFAAEGIAAVHPTTVKRY